MTGTAEPPGAVEFVHFDWNGENLKMFPSQVNVICNPGGWIMNPVLQVDWVKLLHGEQSFEILQPLQRSPVLPGETLVTDIWRDGNVVSFRSRVAKRDIAVLNNGRAVISVS